MFSIIRRKEWEDYSPPSLSNSVELRRSGAGEKYEKIEGH